MKDKYITKNRSSVSGKFTLNKGNTKTLDVRPPRPDEGSNERRTYPSTIPPLEKKK